MIFGWNKDKGAIMAKGNLDKGRIKGDIADMDDVNIKQSDELEQEISVSEQEGTIFDPDKRNLITIDEDTQQEWATEICQEIEKSIQNNSHLLKLNEEKHRIYELEPDRSIADDSSHFELDDNPGIRSIYATVAVQGKLAMYMKAMFPETTWVETDLHSKDKEKREIGSRIRDFLHYILKRMIKIKKAYRDIGRNTCIEDVCVSYMYWDIRSAPNHADREYRNIDEFKADWENAKEAGISESEYNAYIAQLESGEPVSVPIDEDIITYNLPTIKATNREDFVLIPSEANWDTARGKALRVPMKWDTIAKKYANGLFKNIDRIKSRSSGEELIPGIGQTQQDKRKREGTGIGDAKETYKTKEYNIYKVLVEKDIDNSGIDTLCIFTVDYDTRTMLRCEKWDYNLFFEPHYIEPKPNRFEGIGVITKSIPIIKEADQMINLRIKVAKMVTSPSFKALRGTGFDPNIQTWYPGVIWWLDHMEDVEQWDIGVNFPELFSEEQQFERKADMLLNWTSGMSGRELPQDPNAPGNKTGMLINRTMSLIDEDIDVFADGLENNIYNILTMCAKYMQDDDPLLAKFGLEKKDLILARDEVCLRGTSMAFETEIRKQEETQFYQIYMGHPLVQSNPMAQREALYNLVDAWGRDTSKLVPTMEEVFQMQVDIQKEALRQLMAERKQQQEEEGFRRQLRSEGFDEGEIDKELQGFYQAKEKDAVAAGQAPQPVQKGVTRG